MEWLSLQCKNNKTHHKNEQNISSISYNLKSTWCFCPIYWGTRKPSTYFIALNDIVLIRLEESGPRRQRYTTVMLFLEYITKLRKSKNFHFQWSLRICFSFIVSQKWQLIYLVLDVQVVCTHVSIQSLTERPYIHPDY